MTSYTVIVNNSPKTVDVDPRMPLLWVLRDVLGMTGTKYGCGIGACGACTVLIDGEPLRTCQVAINELGSRPVTTIEGLSPDLTHPLQQAWLQEDVPQCGYCQAGQIMQAAALLAKTPRPSDDDIDESMSNNVCRCGTYHRIRQAIKVAAELNSAVRK
jgi:isoquinoline 1-oxidoreductase subunit alpha